MDEWIDVLVGELMEVTGMPHANKIIMWMS